MIVPRIVTGRLATSVNSLREGGPKNRPATPPEPVLKSTTWGKTAGGGPSETIGPRSSGPESWACATQILKEPWRAGIRNLPSRSVLQARVIGNQSNWPGSVHSRAITFPANAQPPGILLCAEKSFTCSRLTDAVGMMSCPLSSTPASRRTSPRSPPPAAMLTPARGPLFGIDDQLGGPTVGDDQAKSPLGVSRPRAAQAAHRLVGERCMNLRAGDGLAVRPDAAPDHSGPTFHPHVGQCALGLLDPIEIREIEIDEFDEVGGIDVDRKVLIVSAFNPSKALDPVVALGVGPGFPHVDLLRGHPNALPAAPEKPDSDLS